MKANEIMRPDPATVTPDEELWHAAELMRYEVDACVPVVQSRENRVLVGVITGRDIAVRCVARRHEGTCRTRDHMTPPPLQVVFEGDDVSEITKKMEDSGVRRIPVVTAAGILVGIVIEADLGRTFLERETRRRRNTPLLERQREPWSDMDHELTEAPLANAAPVVGRASGGSGFERRVVEPR